MKRRRNVLLAAACGGLLALAAISADEKPRLLVLEWAAKAPAETPPVALLIEFGLKDAKPESWAGKATVTGATVVHREGYRFRPGQGDKLTEPDGWKASSRRAIRVPANQPAVNRQEPLATVGVVLHLTDVQPDAKLTVEPEDGSRPKAEVAVKDALTGVPQKLWGGAAVVRRISAAVPVAVGPTEDDFPAACYGPDGTLWVAYVGYHLKDESRRIEQKPLPKQPENFKAYDTPGFGDQVFVKSYRGGKWSDPIAVTDDRQDIVRCAIAVEGDGTVWVVYGANRAGSHAIYGRLIAPGPEGRPAPRLSAERRLTGDEHGISPVVVTDRGGKVRLFHQEWSAQDRPVADVYGAQVDRTRDDAGEFSPVLTTTPTRRGRAHGPNAWSTAAGAGPDGTVAVACDRCEADSDIQVTLLNGPDLSEHPIAATSKFEARPSVCYDPQGRLWVAYEEGPELWGKDFGALDAGDGQPLYSSRSVRVVCLVDGKLFKPAAELPTSTVQAPGGIQEGPAWPKYEGSKRYAYPQIGIDGKGRVWLTYREKFGTRYSSIPGSYWLTFARRLDGDHWSEPIELHHSDGLLDSRPVLLPHAAGGLRVIHNTDGRYTTPGFVHNHVYMSDIDLPGDPVEPKLVPHEPGTKNEKLVRRHEEEQAAVKAIRDYRVKAGGKEYRLLRGEFHRHTELSFDGGSDGSLEDMFRYAIDAASMDWIGNGDHDNGAGREYSWWLVQKFTDAYLVKERFTPMFSYERSVAYPHGHRNCVFDRRGIRTLPRLAEPNMTDRVAGVHADDTKMLYRYLHELGGICASHTSATTMGTDWRDNDPAVEPIVEIYQGDRMSYEKEGAPRAGYEPASGKQPANIAGWKPAGFIDHALGEKGYKLGFESSSDHWSTHISYCIVLAERNDRPSILDALRKRHCYGATDDIVCDVRSGEHVMGDEFTTDRPPELAIQILGTKPKLTVEVLRDSDVVATLTDESKEYRGTWKDPEPKSGTHYYYVRVRQSDGELAWTSPMWVTYQK
jgi:hypothetical protein